MTEASQVGMDSEAGHVSNDTLIRIVKASMKRTHGTWDFRCKEFSNKAKPTGIWDSVWGWVGDFGYNRYAVDNAEATCLAVNHAEQMARELLRVRGVIVPTELEHFDTESLPPAEVGL